MAGGDTIAGKVRIVRQDAEGNVTRILGPHSQDRLDYFNNTVNPNEKLYYNVSVSDRVGAPANAETKVAPDAQFLAGEVLRVQHKSSNLEEAADYDKGDTVNIDILEADQNRGSIAPDQLTIDDQELSSNPTTSKSDWVTFYEVTVPDRKEWRIAGQLEAVAVEDS